MDEVCQISIQLYHYFSDEKEVSERIKSKLMYSYPPEVLNER
jgi:hypothetical protein